jgi:hypothetical protein
VAVAVTFAIQGKNAIFEIEVLNHFHLDQAFCNLFGFLVLRFKGVYQSKSNKVRQFNFYWHGATIGCA